MLGNLSLAKIIKIVASAIAAIGVIVLLANISATVPAGSVGIVQTFGAVQRDVLSPGLHLKAPWQSVTIVSTRLVQATQDSDSASKDLQGVTTSITVQYSLNAAKVPATFKAIGGLDEVTAVCMTPAILQSEKQVTARFTASDLVAQRDLVRSDVEQEIRTFVNSTLQSKGIDGAVQISNVAMTNFKFSPQFEQAIEAKVTAQQGALQAEIEKQKTITQAEATAATTRLAAQAQAYATEQQATANRTLAASITPAIIQYNLALKWDGQYPKVTGGGVPLLSMQNLLSGSNSDSRK